MGKNNIKTKILVIRPIKSITKLKETSKKL